MNSHQNPRKSVFVFLFCWLLLWGSQSFAELRPRADFEPTTKLYVGLSERIDLSPTVLKILSSIQPDIEVHLVAPNLSTLQKTQHQWLTSNLHRKLLRIVWHNLGTADILWLRDYLPYPLFTSPMTTQLKAFSYFHLEPQQKALTQLFSQEIQKFNPIFEHGNLVSSKSGDCFTIPMPELGELGKVPEKELISEFGCRSLTQIPFERGIGHADERLLFINEKLAVTDSETVESILKRKGYEVLRLPPAPIGDRSYVNAVIVNQQIFVPEFSAPEDREAYEVFRQTGLEIIQVPSRELTDVGGGSLHCITRTY